MKCMHIMATEERTRVLKECGVRFQVDQDLDLWVEDKQYEKAARALENALVL